MKKLAMLIGLCALFATGRAEAAPGTMTFTGRLSTSAGPVTGSVNLTFKLYDVATGGTEVWSEVRNNIGANAQGLVFVDLGELTPLDFADFPGGRMYLEITVGTEVLSPRVAVNSVPYSLQASNSTTLGGSISAADVITTAAGTGGVVATKTGNALAVSLVTTSCTTGQAFKYDGSGFACADDASAPPIAGAGIAVSGNTVSLSTTGCAAGEVWKYSGAAWSCDPDANAGPPVAGAGIAVSGQTVSLSTTGCVAGEVWKWSGAVWSCDPDANTTYAAGAGLTLTGTTFSIPTDGITGAMIATNAVTMDQLSVPLGSQSSSMTSSATSGTINYVHPSGAAFTAATSGTCYVTSYVETIPTTPVSGLSYLIAHAYNVTTASNSTAGYSSYLAPNIGGSYYSAQATYSFSVLAGNAYSFGCAVYTSGTFVSRNLSCYSTYICS